MNFKKIKEDCPKGFELVNKYLLKENYVMTEKVGIKHILYKEFEDINVIDFEFTDIYTHLVDLFDKNKLFIITFPSQHDNDFMYYILNENKDDLCNECSFKTRQEARQSAVYEAFRLLEDKLEGGIK